MAAAAFPPLPPPDMVTPPQPSSTAGSASKQRPQHGDLGQSESSRRGQVDGSRRGQGGYQAAQLAGGGTAERAIQRPPDAKRDHGRQHGCQGDPRGLGDQRPAAQQAHPAAQEHGQQARVEDGDDRGRRGDADGAVAQQGDVQHQVHEQVPGGHQRGHARLLQAVEGLG